MLTVNFMEERIKADLKQAMLKRDEMKVSTLRLLLSALRYTSNGRDLGFDDNQVLTVLQKEVKKRKESAEEFRKGHRDDLVQKEESEMAILQSYLPPQISDEELTKLVQEAITELGANSISDMGRVIGVVMQKVGPSADGSRVSSLVKEKLS